MNRGPGTTRTVLIAMLLAGVIGPRIALAVKIGDITHLQGSRPNRLVGMGLVVGLKGTGDGGKYLPAMKPLAELHRRFANPVVTLDDLKSAKNVAIVEVEVTLPREGAREGDTADVHVSSVGAAKSLAGGRLLLTPLVSPNFEDSRVMAMAGGPLHVPDTEVPTVARIAGGATLEEDFIHHYIALGRDLAVYKLRSPVQPLTWIRPDEPHVTFVIDEPHAEWTIAYTIAQAINEDSSLPGVASGHAEAQVAMAMDPRTVVVRLPEAERANPAPFLARLESLQLFMPFTEARVTINRTSGAIVITGDVEIESSVISYKGLTISTAPPPPGENAPAPPVGQREFITLDPQKKGGAKLADLVDALNQLRVTAPDKITIIEQLYATGKLHATLKVEP